MTTESDEGLGRRGLLGAGLGAMGGVAALAAFAAPAEAAASNAPFWDYGPTRATDSRNGIRTMAGKIRGGQSRTISLSSFFLSGYQLTAIVNLTVTSTEKTGYLTLWQSGATRPGVSNINWWGANQTYGNLASSGFDRARCPSTSTAAGRVGPTSSWTWSATSSGKMMPPERTSGPRPRGARRRARH